MQLVRPVVVVVVVVIRLQIGGLAHIVVVGQISDVILVCVIPVVVTLM